MFNRCYCGILVFLLSLICGWSMLAMAQGPAYTDPQKADADFAIQGEYTGRLTTKDGERRFGVQLVALGDGQFMATGYHGGLPGDGWNGEPPVRVGEQSPGRVKDGVLTITCEGGQATVANGQMKISGPNGEAMGTLTKVDRKSPTLGEPPPAGAIVLFDGKDVTRWKNGRIDNGALMAGVTSIPTFGSHKLHIEFCLPFQPQARGQGRGNSGIYLQGRYECQMLDSFGLEGKQNECGGLYSVKDPDLNMCFPPLSWQTYDIDFTAAKYEDGKLIDNPRVTIRHNGVLIHDDVQLPGDRSTTAAPLKPGADHGPVYLQDHGCPVRYRNVWVVPSGS